MKIILLLLLVLLAIMPLTGVVYADNHDDPVTQEVVTPNEEVPTALNAALVWFVYLVGVWGVWSGSVRQSFEKLVKPILNVLMNLLNLEPKYQKPFRTFAIVIGILAAAFVTVDTFGYDVLNDSPWEGNYKEASQIFTALFLTAGAIGFHDALAWNGNG